MKGMRVTEGKQKVRIDNGIRETLQIMRGNQANGSCEHPGRSGLTASEVKEAKTPK